MKHTVLLLFTAFFLSNCNNRQTENPAAQNNDTIQKDTLQEKAGSIFNNPFRDINNFDITVGNKFIDSLHTEYSKTARVTVTKDVCIGDNCESCQTLINMNDQTVLYFFKGDGGEYGFSNDQYFLQNDSLKFVRNFIINIETWPTDSSKTVWKIEETISAFEKEKVACTMRSVLTTDLNGFDFTLKNTAAKAFKADWKGTYHDKAEELKKLLALKDSGDRD